MSAASGIQAHTGPARVFDFRGEAAACEAIFGGSINPGDARRGGSPRAPPAVRVMREMLTPTSAICGMAPGKVRRLITDGRFSGAIKGSAGHEPPVRSRRLHRPGAHEGDRDRIDIEAGRYRSVRSSMRDELPAVAAARDARAGTIHIRASSVTPSS